MRQQKPPFPCPQDHARARHVHYMPRAMCVLLTCLCAMALPDMALPDMALPDAAQASNIPDAGKRPNGTLLKPRAQLKPFMYRAPANIRHSNEFLLRRTGPYLQLSDTRSGRILKCQLLASTSVIEVRGANGRTKDTLILDFHYGSLHVPEGIRYDGGTGGFDTLVLRGGTARHEVHQPQNAHDGRILLDDTSIVYSNIEPINDTSPAATLTINATAAAETINIVNGPVVSGFQTTEVNSATSTFELVRFANKTSVTVNGLGGTDTFNLDVTTPAVGLDTLKVDGGSNADPVNVTNFALASGTLSLFGIGAVTQTGPIQAANLRVSTDNAAITLTNAANDVTNLAGRVDTAGSFAFTDANSLIIDTVDGAAGVVTNDANISLSTGGALTLNQLVYAGGIATITLNAGGAVTQGSGASSVVGAQQLRLLGTGPFTLNNTGNISFFFAANTAGAISYTSSVITQIGSVAGTTGVVSGNNPIALNIFGAVPVTDTRAGADIDAGNSTVTLTAGETGSDHALTLNANAGITGTGGVSLTADNMSIGAAINAGANTATLQPFENGTLIDVGGADAANTLGLTDTEIDQVTAGIIQVGSTNSGNLAVTASTSPAASTRLFLRSGGTVTQAGLASLLVPNLAIQAGSGVTVGTAADTYTNFEASTDTGGIAVNHNGDVTIGGVTTDLPGLRVATSGDIQLTNAGSITLTDNNGVESVRGGGTSGNVTLTAMGVTSNISSTVNRDAITAPGGNINVQAGQDILFGTAGADFDNDVRASGSLTFNAGRDFTISGFADAASDDFGQNTGGGVSLTAGRNVGITDTNGVDASVSANGNGGADVVVTAGADDFFTLSAQSSAALFSSSGDVTVNADRAAITASSGITANAGTVTIQPVSAGWSLDLGSATDAAASTLELSDGELDRVFSPSLRIGTTLNINISQSLTPANASTLSLQAPTGAITESTGTEQTDITVNNLALQANSGIGSADDLDTAVSNLAYSNSGNAVNISNTGNLTINSVAGLTTSSNTGTTTSISAASPLTFAVNTTTAGTATYTAGETSDAPTFSDDLTINSGVTVSVTAGDLTLQAGDDILINGGATASASGALTLTAAFNDLDSEGGIAINGTLSGGPVTVTARNDIIIGSSINVPATSVTITSTNGAIVDNNGATNNVTATSLALKGATGVGAGDGLETQVANLEAGTTTGGIFIDNTGAVTVGGVTASLSGLNVATSGDIQLTNAGSITLTDTDGAESVRGGGTSGNVTLTATGVTSNISSTVNRDAITAPRGDINVQAGQDILFGTAGADFDNDVRASGSLTFNAGRDFTISGFADAASDDFGQNTGGGVSLTAGRNVGITDTNGVDASVSANGNGGADVVVTAGADDFFTLSAHSSAALFSNSGDVTVNADRAAITVSSGITANAGTVTIQPFSSSWNIDLGSATDVAASTLELSDAELDRIFTIKPLHIGNSSNTGSILVSAAITQGSYNALSLRTGGVISETAGSLAVNNVAAQASGVSLNSAGNAITNVAGASTGNFATSFLLTNSVPLNITTIDGVTGITAAQGAIQLTNPNLVTLVGSAGVTATSGDVRLNADRVAIGAAASISALAGSTTLQPASAAWNIDLGSATDVAANTLELSDAELDRISTPLLLIGDPLNSGSIGVSAAIDAGTYNTLSLRTAGSIGGPAGVTVPNLILTDGSATGRTYTVNASSVTQAPAAALPYSTNNLTLNAGNGADTFNVQASPTAIINIDGNDPTTAPGDTLIYDGEGRTVTGDATVPSGMINSPTVQTVNFQEIETISITNAIIAISISDATVTEGDSGTTDAVFTVTLGIPLSQPVTVDFFTSDDTAKEGADYQPRTGTRTFAPGETSKTITVPVNGDTLDEPNETFFVNLRDAFGGTIVDDQGVGTITDDDGAPALSIANVSVAEGNSGSTNASFTVTLAPVAGQTVTVDYATSNGTATAGSDYTAASGTLTFVSGETGKTVNVPILGDTQNEPDETFTVTLSNATNATLATPSATGTITNDDTAVLTLAVTPGTFSEAAGAGAATATVTRNTSTASALAVSLTSSDTTEATVPATVTIPAGQTSATFSVDAVNDNVVDGSQNVTLAAAAAGLTGATVPITVTDDESPLLTVDIAPTSISENGGTATGTVTRNTATSAALVVQLISNDTTEATVPATVNIPAGQASTTFTVNGVDDGIVDGSQIVSISALANTFAAGQATVTVTDDESPQLSLVLSPSTVSESNGAGAATGTVSRNTSTALALTVSLASSDTTEAAVPATVTIPAGQTSATFSVDAVNDNVVDGLQTAIVRASATGFTAAEATLTVTDGDLPDTTVPKVEIVTPADKAVLHGFSIIRGTAVDTSIPGQSSSGIASVTLQLRRVADGRYWTGGTWSPSPAMLATVRQGETWANSTPLPTGFNLLDGKYIIVATAIDNAGNTGRDVANVHSDKTPPQVQFTFPRNGAVVAALPYISGRALDAPGGVGTTRVLLFIRRSSDGRYFDGRDWSVQQVALETRLAGNAFTRDGRGGLSLPAGANLRPDVYYLAAVAFDGADNRGGETIAIRVASDAPLVF